LHDFGFFVLQQLVDRLRVLVRQLLDALLGAMLVVRADLAAVDEVLEVLHRVAPDLADGDAVLFREPAHDLDEILAPFLGQLRDRQADQLAVVRRRETEVGLLDRLLDRADRARVERLHGEHARLRHADRRELLQRRLRSVVVDLDAVKERRRGSARAHGVEGVARMLHGLSHPRLRVGDQLVDGCHVSYLVSMTVPTCSPATTRAMLPSASSNTWIVSLLSIQSESAVVSITFRPRSIASRWVSRGMKRADGSTLGSPSYTPSTPCFAMRIASAPISSARSAAAVSVVKNGLPVPAAKMTMRPFSRWRIARRRMYGSATSLTTSADCTRVSAPC